MSGSYAPVKESQEIEEMKKAIEEIISGHRQKSVLAALDCVKAEVLKVPVYKREIDI